METNLNGKAVRAWHESVVIPTYGVGDPDPNPMFLNKRVYQGSSGVVYPHPVIDSIKNEKQDRSWNAIFLENRYLKIMILPELGGRVQMAIDKTNDYHFVYYNQVIKPALVGLAGPWISGGIEFNWPQHHRPNTFGPVDSLIEENDDGSVTIWCHEIDRMHRTESRHGLTLHPDRAYLEVKVKLFNRQSLPQTFLWWANPAIHVDDNHQSIFPADVTAVLDHGKRDVSSFPIATGTYYKFDYSPGTDISRYRNIPVPTSYMAGRSNYDFVGSYDHGRRAGMLHVCEHHLSPGKKQWTWGNGEFGRAWDRQLTDSDGPYIELMCGVFTDNQPDFSWLMPGEQKEFSQYFMPYKGVGVVGNATIDATVGMEVHPDSILVRVYVTGEFPNATVAVIDSKNGNTISSVSFDGSPEGFFERTFANPDERQLTNLKIVVSDRTGRELVSWAPQSSHAADLLPEPAQAIAAPEELDSVESLYLAGQHIEQYRHATLRAMDYYDEGLRRDPGDARANQAKGQLLYRQGCFAESIPFFQSAIKRQTRHNPNPSSGESYFGLGLALKMVERFEESYAAFYKSTWNAGTAAAAFFELARLASRAGRYNEALGFCQQCLDRNGQHQQALHLRVALLRAQGNHLSLEESHRWLRRTTTISTTHFNFGLLFEAGLMTNDFSDYHAQSRRDANNALELAIDYAAAGLYDSAALVLTNHCANSPAPPAVLLYHLADYQQRLGQIAAAEENRRRALSNPALFFANKLEDIPVLQSAQTADETAADPIASFHLGNLWCDRLQFDRAIVSWESAVAADENFATAWRNLALACFNHRHDADAAWNALERAFSLNPNDARVLYELDQLAGRLSHDPRQRLQRLQKFSHLVQQRDDVYLETVTLHNLLGEHETALQMLRSRQFHPWEGGEGKVAAQYVVALIELARLAIAESRFENAIDRLQQALIWPENLSEGKLVGTAENDVHYWLGVAHQGLDQIETAAVWFEQASEGPHQPEASLYYNDQPPEMVFYRGLALAERGLQSAAENCFRQLIDYGTAHLNEPVTIDYFAVSLPEFLVFEADLDQNNQIVCRFLMGLGYLGLGQLDEAVQLLDEVTNINPAHQSAVRHRSLIADGSASLLGYHFSSLSSAKAKS